MADLSGSARPVLEKLCTIKGAFLFGLFRTEEPFKLMAGTTSVSVPRFAVNELLDAGLITRDSKGGDEDWSYTSYVASEDGRSFFR